ncbi:MarR family transcriptional regulator [Brucella endophytica]|uniref:MarR family transcriptional regulator n=1 Tax=Brucella endophytica TaxID=1963359 RepID=A0A916W9J5_9HYPH|nr:MarR family transcriptional regulator [Brucella endophytica]GGA79261.1 MarR family transcriptional regulator [Brucella endophytica]
MSPQEKENSVPLPLDDQLCYAVYSAGIAIQRLYKPLLDEMGLTYPQYLVLNVLWREDGQTVGGIAEQLALESSTLTPLLKRLEGAGMVRRTRNPDNERQVVVALTGQGQALRLRAGCIGEALFAALGHSPEHLSELNRDVRALRDTIYARIGGWNRPA